MFFKNENISCPAGLAPMAGVTDTAFRTICRRMGAAFTMSEMVSADGLVRKGEKTIRLMRFIPQERPFGIQLFGNDPVIMGEASVIAEELNPDFIDLNAGCPARKVVRRGAGAALMNDLTLLEKILNTMRAAVKLPLSVKIRAGDNPASMKAVEAARAAEACGFDAVIVHPRYRTQGFSGKADWNIIKQVREAVSITVIGNGDINSPEDCHKMMKQTGCDLALIGRGTLGKPWLFAQIAGEISQPPAALIRQTVIEHYKLILADKGEYTGVREMRKHLGWYSKGLPGANEFRRKVMTLEKPEPVTEEIGRFFL
ncbi:tRNA dihydrouridine synthase DusB [bacterium]|nr:tRNA dihydrouridine synthase DusB [FCB group bacterium]MBL7190773.1 tRNA dihydrouridine synthase DusB [bacterium]